MSELLRSIRANKGAIVLGASPQQHQSAAAIASSLLQAVSIKRSTVALRN